MKTKISRSTLKDSVTVAAPARTFRMLLLCGAAAVYWTLSATMNAAPPPPPTPPPDDYPPTTLPLSGNATVAPESTATPPPGTTRINVSTSSKFKGQLEADPKTGVVRITNAHPAGDPAARYEVVVTEFDIANEVIATKYFVLLVETPATCNPVTFAKVSFPVGTNPRSVAIGDFNGDSVQDLAIASGPDKVSVLLGTGMDVFITGPNSPIDVGNTPQSIAVGDFDGDGNQDLVTANAGSDNVSVLLGHGDGTFTPTSPRDIGVGDLPRSIAVADFNNDHKQDLAVVNANSDNVSILLGLGTGDFMAAVNFPVGRDPFAIAVGDFDRDERQDLAVTVRPIGLPNVVSILLNTTPLVPPPNVDFTAPTPFGVGTDPISVALGDFEGLEGDSLPDLVTANQSSGDVSVLVGTDDGSFGPAASFPAGASPQSVAVGDFDGNVAQDLAVANGSNTVSVLLSNGAAGGFGAPTAFVAGSGPSSTVVGDFNGDGMQDLAVVNINSNDVSILLRRCPCPPIITHSTSQEITADNSVSCNLGGPPGSFHMDNSYWRAFDMEMFTGSQPSLQYDVTSVSFGIETAAAGSGATDQLVMVNLYAQTSGIFPGGTRTSILPNPIPVMVPNQALTILHVPLEATVPAGTSELVMEVFTPSGQPDHNSFFIGSNTAPETGPSYISAAGCEFTTPTTTTALGFPNMHVVFNVNGSCVGGTPTPGTQALNLSTRLRVQTGDNVGIGGFIITGTAPKHVLLRAIGPSLTDFGVPGALADPVLELNGPSGFVTITNNNWRDTQEAAIIATGIPPSHDFESAIDATLAPGAYTAILRGNGNTSGVGLIELYDLNPGAASKLGNISTRAFVSTGDNIVIAGFTLGSGNGNDAGIVVRGIGPSLAAAGVPNAMADPTLELRDSNGTLLVANNDWQDNPEQAAELVVAGLAPANQLESGIAATLPPGLYTALLAGLNNGTGVGLVEVYDLGAP